ncbi:MAG: adenosylcobalamin-dependent ribonucleoside-diphosphate reductase [Candidatus Aenigmarchaeota archaeon]|nr:adenosylcobalamin-dependent ribonucleoside-diphosphate reductase [Candidatus Aenigmarchaeota archaeon]MDW8160184.1 adenosylcobalamin-dependent ribonucleoside-diphosphate reductase [Candidatus Aenigmarchaeota archaeon]
MIEKIRKRDGRIVPFDKTKIAEAIWKAAQSVGGTDKELSYKLADKVVEILERSLKPGEIPHVEQVQDLVEKVLVENGHYKTAKAYITYRKKKEEIRNEKIAILQGFYEEEVAKKFSINALRLMANRYLLKNEEGKLIEGPKQMFERVAMLVVIPDLLYDKRVFEKDGGQKIWEKENFNPEEYENKLGFKTENGWIFWNRYHLERMKNLYDELNSQGKMKVSWSDFLKMVERGEFQSYYKNFKEYFDLMVCKKFLPNSPTLFNAGARLGQLSACFVVDINDNMESIMDAAKECAIIFKSGGGVGINYSKLRPEGDIVASTTGVASGPVSFMKIVDVVTDVVKQGGKRRGANMGILESWHPDILKFIHAKEKEGQFENFNISVMLDEKFWEAYKNGEKYALINPRNGKVVTYVDPKFLLEEIARMAWKTADPGVLFLDNINRRNVQKESRGLIRSTNPCGEQTLYEYESCNLGSINLYSFIKIGNNNEVYFDWEDYRKTIEISYRFLDNIIDVNKYPIEKIDKASKAVRRIGLGFMGLADAMFALKIPYSSEEGFKFIERVSEFLTYYAMKASVERAKERGVFPYYHLTSYKKGEMPIEGFYHPQIWNLDWEDLQREIVKNGIRNADVTTIPPTGSISMFFDVSSGIEPQFSLVFEKRVTAGSFYYVDIEFERQLKQVGLYSDEILKKVAENAGSVQGIEEIPEEMRRVFITALDIPWWDHVRAQASAQLWITNSISKTINMPSFSTVEDVLQAYIAAYHLGCKGITIYREGSKSKQVLYVKGNVEESRIKEYMRLVKNNTLKILKKFGLEEPKWVKELELGNSMKKNHENGRVEKCPNCDSLKIVYQAGCVVCSDCGWSACLIS